jgi:L,D-transpeptidase YcbB
MNNGKEETVTLKNRQAVNINYLTAWVDKYGHMNFRPDVYNHDNEAMDKMFAAK